MEGWQPTVDLLGEDGHVTRRTTGALVAALTATLLVSGCGSALKAAKVDAKAEASATATQSTPGPPPPAPKVGKCYDLSYKESLQGTSKADPVPCKDKHTSVTIYVGEFDPIVDGHLLAVDSDEVQAQIAKVCPSKVSDWVAGRRTRCGSAGSRPPGSARRWRSPTRARTGSGATWSPSAGRSRSSGSPGTKGGARRSGRARHLRHLQQDRSRRQSKKFAAVACAEPHSWRAVSVIDLDKDVEVLGPPADKAADEACKAQAQQRASDPLNLKWAFQWPSKEAFDAGQRYGLCWVPDKA